MRFMIVISAVLLFAAAGQAALIIVPDDYATIQAAIDAAAAGDTIAVKPGTYKGAVDFKGKAVTVKSRQGPAATIIDGDQILTAVLFENGEGMDSVLEGFTVTNGLLHAVMCDRQCSPQITGNTFENCGSGIFCRSDSSPLISGNTLTDLAGPGINIYQSSAVIVGNHIHGNETPNNGAGILCATSSALIEDNLIEDNEAGVFGGGIECSGDNTGTVIRGNVIKGNSAGIGGAGIHFSFGEGPVISGNAIIANKADNGFGGGLHVEGGVDGIDIAGNLIEGNSALFGGGIDLHVLGTGDDIKVLNNRITSNTAAQDGGGIYCNCRCDVAIAGNVIAFNQALEDGGGISFYWSTSTTTANNTLVGNSAGGSGGAIAATYQSNVTAANSILWGNGASLGKEIHIDDPGPGSTILAIGYCDVEGGQASAVADPGGTLVWGLGMIDTAPLFVDPAAGDFHLTFKSPCRNTGLNYEVPPALTEDIEGDPRIFDGFADMGADEMHVHLYHVGDVAPGALVHIRVVGYPGATPVRILYGSGIQDPPQSTQFGDLYLQWPIREAIFGPIPSSGVLDIPAYVPTVWEPGEDYPFQSLIGFYGSPDTRLTNLMVLRVD